jgi:hypothetical protein
MKYVQTNVVKHPHNFVKMGAVKAIRFISDSVYQSSVHTAHILSDVDENGRQISAHSGLQCDVRHKACSSYGVRTL